MIKKTRNNVYVEGRVYQHDLKIKTVQNEKSANYGKEFIAGDLSVATDEDGLNVVTIHYTYVTPTTKAGGSNATFDALKKIIDDNKTWIQVGKDEAVKVKINSSLALNDFYNRDNTLVSAKTIEGGFVTIVNAINVDETKRSRFNTDIVITKVTHIEADEEKGITEDFTRISGAVFNFRNAILPIDFIVRNPNGMRYFEGLDITPSEPVFTRVEGNIVSQTISKEIEEDGAFGKTIRKVDRKLREWCVDWASPTPYEFGEENVLTIEDLQKASQDRELHLAEVKKNHEDYLASRGNSSSIIATTTPSSNIAMNMGNFTF